MTEWTAETRKRLMGFTSTYETTLDDDIHAALAHIDRLEARIGELHEREYRLLGALRHIRWWVINGNTPVLVRLGMIEQTVLQALGDRLYEDKEDAGRVG